MQQGSRKAVVAALLANSGIAAAKFLGFLATGASSMLAESVHSVADAGNQGLLLLGGARARRRATPEHPFGYGRERYFWSFVVALVLFTLGSLFALYEGQEKLRHPHELESVGWAVGILGVAIVMEWFSLRTAVVEARGAKGGASWWAFVRHSKTPELPVVLLEDIGAMVGLVLALGGVGLAELSGDARWDAVGTISIGLLLGVIAVVLVIEMKSLLIGESATPAVSDAIARALTADGRLRRVIHMKTQHLGPDELLVAAKIEVDHELSLGEVAALVDEAEARVRAAVADRCVMYLEPDVARSGPAGDRPEPVATPAPPPAG